jgi:hypothetical protein
MDDFIIQTSTFLNFEGWGTCLTLFFAQKVARKVSQRGIIIMEE